MKVNNFALRIVASGEYFTGKIYKMMERLLISSFLVYENTHHIEINEKNLLKEIALFEIVLII